MSFSKNLSTDEDFNLEWLDEQILDINNEYDGIEDTPNVQGDNKTDHRAIKKPFVPTWIPSEVCLRWRAYIEPMNNCAGVYTSHEWTVQTTTEQGLSPTLGIAFLLFVSYAL